MRFIDLKWQLREAKNKKNAKQKAQFCWNKIAKVIKMNTALRRKLQKNNHRYKSDQKLMNQIIEAPGTQREMDITEAQKQRHHQLKNHTLISQPPINQEQMFKMASLKVNETTVRHRKFLMNLYFFINADGFIRAVNEPFPHSYRRLIIESDLEYNKLLNTYLRKCQLYEQWLQEQQRMKLIDWRKDMKHILHKNPMERTIDPLIISRSMSEQERLFMDRLSELERFEQQNMQKTFQSSDNITDQFKSTSVKSKQQKKKIMKLNNSSSNFYYAIRHNKMKTEMIEEIFEESVSNNQSNASITEAALDILYTETKELNKKLATSQNEKQLAALKRVKYLLKLEEIKMKTQQTNNAKLHIK